MKKIFFIICFLFLFSVYKAYSENDYRILDSRNSEYYFAQYVATSFNSGLLVSGGWTYIQQGNIGCSAGTTTCTATFPVATTAGDALIVDVFNGASDAISSVSGAGTWHTCSSSSCLIYSATLLTEQDMAYNLNATGGVTSITVTLTSNFSTSSNCNTSPYCPSMGIWEWSPPTCGGSLCTVAFDGGNAVADASCSTCTLAAPNVSATDLVFHIFNANGGASSNGTDCSSPYLLGYGGAWCVGLNVTSGTAPTFTQSPSTAITDSAIAFKISNGTFTPSPLPLFNLVAAPNNAYMTCTPVCPAFTIQSTGSGHLLFVTVTDKTNTQDFISSVSGCGTWVVPSGAQKFVSGSGSISSAYVLSSTASCTSFTITMTASTGTNGVGGPDYSEWSRSSGSFVLDTSAASSNGTASTTATGQALTLTGTDDLCFQGIEANTINGDTSPNVQTLYFMPAYNSGGCNNVEGYGATCALPNTVNGNAPTWLQTQSAKSVVNGICFK